MIHMLMISDLKKGDEDYSFLDGEFQTLYVHIVVGKLVDEGYNIIALHGDQDKWGLRWTIGRRVGSSDTTRVNEVFAIVLSDLVLMGMSTH